MIIVLMALAGGTGAGARFVVDGLIRSRIRAALPWGTILVNISGSLLLGLLAGTVLSYGVPPDLQIILGTGFLGGYTTFSTASIETVRLIQARRGILALVNGLGTLMATVLAAAAGLALATL